MSSKQSGKPMVGKKNDTTKSKPKTTTVPLPKKGMSKSEEIVKEVTKGAPKSYDPESADLGDVTPAMNLYNGDVYDDFDVTDSNLQGVRIRGEIPSTFTTGKYAGAKAKRDAEDEMYTMKDSDDEEDGDQYDDDDMFGAYSGKQQSDDDDDDDEGEYGGVEEDDEDDGIGFQSIGSTNVDKADELIKRLKEEEEEELKSAPSIFNNDKGDQMEMEKAKHTKNQTTIYDELLMTRIHLQKGINMANRMPKSTDFKTMLELNPSFKEEHNQAMEETRDLLSTVFNLQSQLIQQNPAIQSSKKRIRETDTLSEIWLTLEAQNERLLKFTNSTIEQWNNRVNLGSDSLKRNLKSINQPILTQISNTLNDFDRLTRRTKLKRTNFKIIGQEVLESPDIDNNENEEDKLQKQLQKQQEDQYEDEIFDDTDFYQLILKEIESSGDSNDIRREASLLKQRKKKRQSNSKVNKDRTLKYDVFPKLENFMPPEPTPLPEWNIEQLYKGLFGGIGSAVETIQ